MQKVQHRKYYFEKQNFRNSLHVSLYIVSYYIAGKQQNINMLLSILAQNRPTDNKINHL